MTLLWDEEDRDIRDEDAILEQVYKYYADLYSQPPISSADKWEQDKTLNLIDHRVYEKDNLKLMAEPGIEEPSEEIKKLPLNKSLEEDSLSAEVLREMWDEISPCSHKFIWEVWHNK
ncbi:hypothetical protein R1flu_028916 [Riccia fluitans]|uniref:Uncharacterized protein n=1 Tax=Riccia fluitans TaxID=41844 RepID=A0ABD1XN14_9MARC